MKTRLFHLARSIRFRLTLLYSAILSIVLVGFSLSLIVVFSNTLFWISDTSLTNQAAQIQQQIKLAVSFTPEFPTIPYPATSNEQNQIRIAIQDQQRKSHTYDVSFVVTDQNGNTITDKNADPLRTQPATVARVIAGKQDKPTTVDTSVHGQPYKIVTIPVNTGQERVVLQVAHNLSDIQDTLEHVFLYMKITIPGIVLATTVLAWFLAGRVLGPVEKIRRVASEISLSDLSRRLNMKGEDELAHLAATFDSMIDRLDQAIVRQKQFTSDASHELRTPLAIMQADISFALRRQREPREYEAVLESAQEEITRMTRIVEDLSMLARMDSSKLVLDMKNVAVDGMLHDLAGRIEVLASEKGVAVYTHHLYSATILADERLLKQLILNLLNNALAYTPPGGRITVSMVPPDPQNRTTVGIQVIDTGVGIPTSALPHIFDRFYRVDTSRQRHPGGSGLGLAICQSIVQAHGGQITVESEEHHGTTMTVMLPIGDLLALPLSEGADSIAVDETVPTHSTVSATGM